MKRLMFLVLFVMGITPAMTQRQSFLDSIPNLGNFINTDFQEVKPLISPDGMSLYFCRRNHPENVYGVKDDQDIWVARREESGQWGTAVNLGKTINNKHANAICALSPDGKMGIFYNSYGKLKQPLAKAHLVNNQWTQPEPVEVEDYYNINEYADFYPCFVTNVLFMAIEREDSYGDQDIYISKCDENGSYQKPINLGNIINTPGADFSPFLASDGKTLFFASFGHKGHGGSDIYMSQRLDDSWTKWSPPVNMGPSINSKKNEAYFSITTDFRFLYLDAYTPLREKRDIICLMVPDELRPRRYRNATIAPKIISLMSKKNKRF